MAHTFDFGSLALKIFGELRGEALAVREYRLAAAGKPV